MLAGTAHSHILGMCMRPHDRQIPAETYMNSRERLLAMLAAAAHLVVLGLIHLLLPRLEPIRLPGRTGVAFLTGRSTVDSVSSGDAL